MFGRGEAKKIEIHKISNRHVYHRRTLTPRRHMVMQMNEKDEKKKSKDERFKQKKLTTSSNRSSTVTCVSLSNDQKFHRYGIESIDQVAEREDEIISNDTNDT